MQSRTILNLHSGVPAMAGFCQVWVRERQGKRIWLTLITPEIDSLGPTLPACVSL